MKRDSYYADLENEGRPPSQGLTESALSTTKWGTPSGSFDELVVVAEPRFMGVLLASLEKTTRTLVKKKIQKDLLFLKDHELKDSINIDQEAG